MDNNSPHASCLLALHRGHEKRNRKETKTGESVENWELRV